MAEINSSNQKTILDYNTSLNLNNQFLSTINSIKLTNSINSSSIIAVKELNDKINLISENYFEEKRKQYFNNRNKQSKTVTLNLYNKFSFEITNLEYFMTKLLFGITVLKLCEKHTKLFYVYFPVGFKTLCYSTVFYWSYKHYIKYSK